MKRHQFVSALFFGLIIFSASSLTAAPTLGIGDCVKCHELQPTEIETAGAAHKDQINCLDCHAGHRPVSANNIPACAQCHEGAEHYELNNCMSCHNPHQPLAVVLEGELKAECLTCHKEQNAQLLANPSMHTEVSCNFCHAEKHGHIPDCTSCHEPHSADMTQKDCAVCHEAHQPMVLQYADTTQNLLCAACHDTAYSKLLATKPNIATLVVLSATQINTKRSPDAQTVTAPLMLPVSMPSLKTVATVTTPPTISIT